ncbi:MAG: FG-GAP-like repeat, partial [Thermoleophilaceae bacterium]|nr:FG-GAP-like repeat [Thermoleophilaceae bacterium]
MARSSGPVVSVRAALLAAVLLAATLVGAGSAGASTQSPSFARSDYQQLGNNHVLADFNGDGRLDLAGIGAQSAAVLLSNGAGTFGARVEYQLPTFAQDLAAGDFNGDG